MSEKETKQWTRKVQKTGGATFIVGLPKDWCEENSITDEHLAKLKDKGQGIEKIRRNRSIPTDFKMNG